jgi:hypothetical protein
MDEKNLPLLLPIGKKGEFSPGQPTACGIAQCGSSHMWELIGAGRVKSVMLGGHRRIVTASLLEHLRTLPEGPLKGHNAFPRRLVAAQEQLNEHPKRSAKRAKVAP